MRVLDVKGAFTSLAWTVGETFGLPATRFWVHYLLGYTPSTPSPTSLVPALPADSQDAESDALAGTGNPASESPMSRALDAAVSESGSSPAPTVSEFFRELAEAEGDVASYNRSVQTNLLQRDELIEAQFAVDFAVGRGDVLDPYFWAPQVHARAAAYGHFQTPVGSSDGATLSVPSFPSPMPSLTLSLESTSVSAYHTDGSSGSSALPRASAASPAKYLARVCTDTAVVISTVLPFDLSFV